MSKGSVIAAVAVALLLVSLAVPAAGGPNAVSAVSALKLAKKALKKANAADRRSKRALKEAQSVGQGPPGPAGAPGPAGVPGAPGSDAFGSLTYVFGLPGTADATGGPGYAISDAPCPAGMAPTGGSGEFAGGEPGGTIPDLADSGSLPDDLDGDGFYDDWFAYVYNSSGTAKVYATAVCAPAGSAAALLRVNPDRSSIVDRLRKLAAER